MNLNYKDRDRTLLPKDPEMSAAMQNGEKDQLWVVTYF